MKFDVELVGKIGSMALIDKKDNMIDYTRVARLSRELKPGYIWISSGATEIGRLDYMMRAGRELPDTEESKTDYSAQGQAISCRPIGSTSTANIRYGRSSSSTITLTTRSSASISANCCSAARNRMPSPSSTIMTPYPNRKTAAWS